MFERLLFRVVVVVVLTFPAVDQFLQLKLSVWSPAVRLMQPPSVLRWRWSRCGHEVSVFPLLCKHCENDECVKVVCTGECLLIGGAGGCSSIGI